MNIIYRLYQITNDNDIRKVITQDVMMVNNKEEFKEAIKLTYGDDIKFKHTKDLKEGDIFVSIISYDCYNAEEYVRVDKFVCANCNQTFKENKHHLIKGNYWSLERICKPLYDEKIKELEQNVYCCKRCREEYEEKLKEKFTKYAKENNILSEFWVDRYNTFENKNCYGYIYMISKKSTGEFYVGQTNAVPMFRWVQHLKTERFKVENIVDYKFEVLEEVKYKKDINNREAYWINKKYNENPNLSLNIMKPKEKYEMNNIFDIMEEENE